MKHRLRSTTLDCRGHLWSALPLQPPSVISEPTLWPVAGLLSLADSPLVLAPHHFENFDFRWIHLLPVVVSCGLMNSSIPTLQSTSYLPVGSPVHQSIPAQRPFPSEDKGPGRINVFFLQLKSAVFVPVLWHLPVIRCLCMYSSPQLIFEYFFGRIYFCLYPLNTVK